MSTARDVLVAIPTFHRPAQLDALLTALAPQLDAAAARVLVIDNDPAGSAATVVGDRARYVVEPGRGLAAVRNRALDEAAGARALVFIDDDEVPAPDWLPTLVGVWRATGAEAVSGRVETRFPAGFADPWIEQGGFFTRVRFASGASQAAAATNNLLLDVDAVARLGLRFDARLGLTGGEDILFTSLLVRGGGRIVSAPEALVHDDVTADRLTRRWVLRRAYRVGLSTVATRRFGGAGAGVRVVGALGGAARLALGGARWALGTALRSPRHAARGARASYRGAGMIAGAMGFDYREYALRHAS